MKVSVMAVSATGTPAVPSDEVNASMEAGSVLVIN
jgi:hypothetical protein